MNNSSRKSEEKSAEKAGAMTMTTAKNKY